MTPSLKWFVRCKGIEKSIDQVFFTLPNLPIKKKWLLWSSLFKLAGID